MEDNCNYLIIGGGVAGTTAAETIRSKDSHSSIVIISDENNPLYSKPLLAHYLSGETKREDLFLKKPDFYKKNKIELVLGRKVEKLDSKERLVILDNNEVVSFGKCLIATGAQPREWILDGKIIEGIYDFRTIEDAEKIKKRMGKTKEAVVIGGGFISIELSKVFLKSGINTTLLIKEPYCMMRALDEEQGRIIHEILAKNGVRIVTGEEVMQVNGTHEVGSVITNTSRDIHCELVCLGIGLIYNLSFLDGSGIETNKGVLTDKFLKTNTPGIYAAGDVAEYYDVILGFQHLAPNWTTALTQGRTAGLNMAGNKNPYKAVPSQTVDIFGTNLDFIGYFSPSGDEEIIIRKSPNASSYGRILLRNARIIGATLINQSKTKNVLINLILNQVEIGEHKDKLRDFDSDLSTLA